jgi:hypothetical protein
MTRFVDITSTAVSPRLMLGSMSMACYAPTVSTIFPPVW